MIWEFEAGCRLQVVHHPDFVLRTKSVPPETGGKKMHGQMTDYAPIFIIYTKLSYTVNCIPND